MRQILANVAVPKEEAQKRIDLLKKSYPDADFKAEDHETRSRIVVNWDGDMPQVDYERMRNIASGAEVESADRRSTKPRIRPDQGRQPVASNAGPAKP